jgi:cytochrome P450
MQAEPLPGPRPWPVLGTSGNLLRFALDPLRYVERLFRQHGPVAALVRGRSRRIASPGADTPAVVFIHGPELNRAVLADHERFHKSALSGPLFPEHGTSARTLPLRRMLTGLFHVNGDVHRKHRRLLMPAFHKSRIDGYRADMVAITEAVVARFQMGSVRNLREDMTELTLRIVTKTLFGSDMREQGLAIARELSAWLAVFRASASVPWDLPGLPYRRFLDLSQSVDRRLVELIAERRRLARSGDDMLSMLLEAHDESGARLDDDELIGHVGTIFAAGHETSANALCWTLFLLSQHPEVEAALAEELSTTLRGEAPSLDALSSLPLLERVIKESLRLFPPAPMNHRIAAEDCEIGGFAVPRSSEVLSSIYHTHRQPDLYPEPRRFRPERWQAFDPGPYAYNPFGVGPRMCIGATFAQMELKIVLAILLQRFRFELLQERRLDRLVSIVMAPGPGLFLRLQPVGSRLANGSRRRRGSVWKMLELD